jgi:hypothetical protein
LDESAMTTKRSAAAARIFSRVCAPQPSVRGDLVRAVDRDVETVDAGEVLHPQAQFARGVLGARRGGSAENVK